MCIRDSNKGLESFEKRDDAANKLAGISPGKLIARMMSLASVMATNANLIQQKPVSYTHLDVYKRQQLRILDECFISIHLLKWMRFRRNFHEFRCV